MRIFFEKSPFKIEITYDENGKFQYAVDSITKTYMMVNSPDSNGDSHITANYMHPNMVECSAKYVWIVEANVFVPKYIFIANV